MAADVYLVWAGALSEDVSRHQHVTPDQIMEPRVYTRIIRVSGWQQSESIVYCPCTHALFEHLKKLRLPYIVFIVLLLYRAGRYHYQ